MSSSRISLDVDDSFYQTEEFKSHHTQIKNDISYEYLNKFSSQKTLYDKDVELVLLNKIQIKRFTYDVQSEKETPNIIRSYYYDRLPDPNNQFRVRGVKPKNDMGYNYTEQLVDSEIDIKLPEKYKYKTISVGFILNNTKRLVVSNKNKIKDLSFCWR